MSKNKKTNEEIVETLVDVNRVTKVTSGGRSFSFSARVIVGTKKGEVGYAHGKAKEVPEARSKASRRAKRSMIRVPIYQGRTIHHDVVGRCGAGKVILRRAKAGTGVIAGGPMRAIFECLGIHDIVAKSLGSTNVYALIGATMDALKKLSSPKMVTEKRNMRITDISTMQKTNKDIDNKNIEG